MKTLSISPRRVIYEGKNGFVIFSALDVKTNSEVVLKSMGNKSLTLEPFKVYSVACEREVDAQKRESWKIIKIESSGNCAVDKRNFSAVVMALYGLTRNASDALQGNFLVRYKGKWPIQFEDFKKRIEADHPDLNKEKSSKAGTSINDKLYMLWSPHSLAECCISEQYADVWQMVIENPLMFFVPHNPFGLPRLSLSDLRPRWKEITGTELPVDADWVMESSDALESKLTKSRALSAVHNAYFSDRVMCKVQCDGVEHVMFKSDSIVAEKLASSVKRIMYGRKPIPFSGKQVDIGKILNNDQMAALRTWHSYRFVALTGPAGTGKSWVAVSFLLELIPENVLVVSVASRVASEFSFKLEKLASESGLDFSKVETDNIDQVLTCIRHNTKRGAKLRSQVEVLLIEESSMVSPKTLMHLLEALPKVGFVGMIGDTEQLGPVTSSPSFFNGFVRKYTGTKVVRELKKVMRTEKEDLLYSLSELRRRRTDSLKYGKTKEESSFVVLEREDTIQASVRRLVSMFGDQEVSIITQKNSVVDEFNRLIFAHRFPNIKEYNAADIRVGEKILITRNLKADTEGPAILRSSKLDNGSLFTIEEIIDYENGDSLSSNQRVDSTRSPSKFGAGGYTRVAMLSGGLRINLNNFKDFKRGYAVTVYSFQGSEAPLVYFYIHPDFSGTLEWKQAYVACSRAREQLIVECKPGDLSKIMTDNDYSEDTRIIEEALPEFDAERMYSLIVRKTPPGSEEGQAPVSEKKRRRKN